MLDTERLVEIMQGYGEVIEGRIPGKSHPVLQKGIWWIPLTGARALRVEEAALPLAVQGLLRLYLQAVAPESSDNRGQWQAVLHKWLAGRETVEAEQLTTALAGLGVAGGTAVIVAIQIGKGGDPALLDDAVQLLQELLDEQQAMVVRQGERRMYVLMHESDALAPATLTQTVSAWIDTLGSELYLLAQAGISTVVAGGGAGRGLMQAREEAEFALMAGSLYRSKDAVHEYGRLGLARVLYGLPHGIRQRFVGEVLPDTVAANLTPELRETIFAFFEHGQQVADTARSLFIHRNTLLYRLDRIAELSGCDIRKPMQGWTLWLALTLSRTDSPNETK